MILSLEKTMAVKVISMNVSPFLYLRLFEKVATGIT